jgi:hypothetical protein
VHGLKLVLSLLLSIATLFSARAQHVLLDGTAKVEIYNDVDTLGSKSQVTDLKANPNYPDQPTSIVNTKFIEYPPGPDTGVAPSGDTNNYYGIRMTGLITVDQTADYVFTIASQNNGEFWLSSDSTPDGLLTICSEPFSNPVRSFMTDWTQSRTRNSTSPGNVSSPRHLIQGRKYFFTGYMKTVGYGADRANFAVAARVASDAPPPDGSFPIFSSQVSSGTVITSQPRNTAVINGTTASFSVEVSGPAFFQWNKDGIPIPGAANQSYTTPPVSQEDNGAKYSVTVRGATGASVASAEAALQVVGTRLYTEGFVEYASWESGPIIFASASPINAFDDRLHFSNSRDAFYGSQDTHDIFGDFVPDETGTYYFHLKSGSKARLFFNRTNAALPNINQDFEVATDTGCCHGFLPPGTISTAGPFLLTAAHKYGIVAIAEPSQNVSNGHLQVAFTRDGLVTGLDPTDLRNKSVISSKYLASLHAVSGPDLVIVDQPQNLSLEDNRSGTLSVKTSAALGIVYQWQSAASGSSIFTDIPNATESALSINADLATNNGTQYRVKLHAQGQDLISDVAVLTVRPDIIPPRISSAHSSANLDAVVLTFTEAVTGPGVFSLSTGLTVKSSEQVADTVIVLHTPLLSTNTSYLVTTTGLADLTGNTITPPNNSIAFISGAAPSFPPAPPSTRIPGFTTFERYDEADLNTIQTRIDNGPPPEVFAYLDHFEQVLNQGDDYASRKYGWFVPSVTGSYVFFVASMFGSRLYLSPDANAANKKLIASETNYSLNREWTSSLGSSSLDAKRSDRFADTQWPGGNTIILLAGQPYYIEQRHHDPGGIGDAGTATFTLAGEADPLNGAETRITGSVIFTYALTSGGPPIITKDPVGTHFNKGDTIVLTVEAVGTAPLTYQWYKSKKAIRGAVSSTYVITNAAAADVGDYAVRVVDIIGESSNTFLKDNAARLIMNGATLNIEAEDFNYEGGKALPIASAAPYIGGAFKGLKGALDIDFMNNGDDADNSAFAYNRFQQFDTAVVEMKGPADPPDYNRGSWNVIANYAIGWNAPLYWQNYTRTLPSGYYNIFVGAARDGLDALDRLDGSGPEGTGIPTVNMALSKVANPTVADGSTPGTEGGAQGLTNLGSFISPGTGAWSSNDLIPLTDQSGNIAEVLLGGTVTLRLTSASDQDADFLLLYLIRPDQTPLRLEASRNGSQLVITWTQGGTLEYADQFAGTNTLWISTGDSDGSYTSSIDQAHRFYRLRK